MRKVSKGELEFNVDVERENLQRILNYLTTNLNYRIFRASNGILTPNYFDAIMLSLDKYFDFYSENPIEFKSRVENLKTSQEYKDAGLSAYSLSRIKSRVLKAFEIFNP